MKNFVEAPTLPIEPETLEEVVWGVATSERPTRRMRKLAPKLTSADFDDIIAAYMGGGL